jgi:hypothetical protein
MFIIYDLNHSIVCAVLLLFLLQPLLLENGLPAVGLVEALPKTKGWSIGIVRVGVGTYPWAPLLAYFVSIAP